MRVNSNKNKPTNTIKPTIHNVFILDSSGSMKGSKYNSATNGILMEIDELKKSTEVNYTQTIVEFSGSNESKYHCWLTKITDIPKMNFQNMGDMTALYKTVIETIEKLVKEVKKNDKVLLKIFTDGQDNCSGWLWSKERLKELINKVEKNNGFTVTFEGTEIDTASVIRDLGISASNTHVHDNTAAGITRGVQSRVAATLAYSKSVLAGEDVKTNFYTKSINK